MSRPSRDAADGKHWGKHIRFQAKHVKQRGRIKIHVGIQFALFEVGMFSDRLIELGGNIEPFALFRLAGQRLDPSF
jgi:hypothetical protein